ncbi:copper chaperone PCu(A)C [Brachybacterium sp. AOP43-C2-M15]|uniref:copper chaperone PCu(A)C n=1 Tax=Brachybacterium sp. AOP43-C2-M15 TaxID=3457661 RepID=UPI0040338766
MSRSTSHSSALPVTASVSSSVSASVSPPAALPVSAPLPRRAALAALLLPLAACSGGTGGGADGARSASDGGSEDGAEARADGGGLTVTDPWIKAAASGMSAAFGTVTNGTDQDLVLVAATTPVSPAVELHETASDGSGGMSMREKEGGFALPAGEELVLEPGGNHLMLMDLAEPLLPGDEVELTLEFEDGTEHPFTATVKDFAGAQEQYEPEHSPGSGASDGGGEHDESGHAEHGDAGHGADE